MQQKKNWEEMKLSGDDITPVPINEVCRRWRTEMEKEKERIMKEASNFELTGDQQLFFELWKYVYSNGDYGFFNKHILPLRVTESDIDDKFKLFQFSFAIRSGEFYLEPAGTFEDNQIIVSVSDYDRLVNLLRTASDKRKLFKASGDYEEKFDYKQMRRSYPMDIWSVEIVDLKEFNEVKGAVGVVRFALPNENLTCEKLTQLVRKCGDDVQPCVACSGQIRYFPDPGRIGFSSIVGYDLKGEPWTFLVARVDLAAGTVRCEEGNPFDPYNCPHIVSNR